MDRIIEIAKTKGRNTVEPPVSGPLRTRKSVRLREVSAYGRLKMNCLYAENMTKCPLTGGVR